MINFTKFSLRRPVTVVLCLVSLVFFGLQSILGSKLELMPEMEFPMMVVSTVYPGASPQDINDLISKEIEDAVSTLESIDTVSSYSMENSSVVLLQYEYGTNMDKAYTNLKKTIDRVKSDLPDDAEESNIIEMDMNAEAVLTLAVSGGTDQNLYNYVENTIVPEFEKLSSVGEVSISGGQESYIRVELIPEKMNQYGLSMNTVGRLVGAADFTVPAGSAQVGNQEFSVSVGNRYERMEQLEMIPIPLSSGDVIHLSDIARVYQTLKEVNSIGRYNGSDIVTIAIQKQQSSSAVDVSKQVMAELEQLQNENPQLHVVVVNDSSEMIMDSIQSVMETMLMAIGLSMLVLFLFLGDWRASVIVGSSIPISVLLALIAMRMMGFSMNVISLGSLVLGVGMMVDNSIVVLESCFRTTQGRSFREAAVEGTAIVANSVAGSTVTTCVVFFPLALLQGLSGQLFSQLGYTVVFCMTASLISAVTVVPLCYMMIKPKEKEDIVVNIGVKKLQDGYRKLVARLLPKKKTVLLSSVGLLAIAFLMAGKLGIELMPASDEGIVSMSVKMKPGLTIDSVNEIVKDVESFVMADLDVEKYLITYGGNGLSLSSDDVVTLNAYLKSDRSMSTENKIASWKEFTNARANCTITMESGSSSGSMMSSGSEITVNIQSVDYDKVKTAADEFVAALKGRHDITKVHSSIENAAPIIKVDVDPVLAQAEGMTPAEIGGVVYNTLSGMEVMELTINGNEIKVRTEFPDDEYDTLNKVESLMLATAKGTNVTLADVADIYYEDSPQTVTRVDKQYQVSITAQPIESYKKTAESDVKAFAQDWSFPIGVSFAENSMDKMMGEELGALAGAIGTAVFLVFVVMAMQFESPKFSLMVMFTIPFSLIGAFGLLYLAGSKISMVSMLGFLMMVGTVVNNGILYVETVNQYREEMDLQTALIEAGATRLRPIMMTTLTTVLSMIPMCLAYGDSGETMQGLALVNVGGLLASTVLALLLLPTLYQVVDNLGKKRVMA